MVCRWSLTPPNHAYSGVHVPTHSRAHLHQLCSLILLDVAKIVGTRQFDGSAEALQRVGGGGAAPLTEMVSDVARAHRGGTDVQCVCACVTNVGTQPASYGRAHWYGRVSARCVLCGSGSLRQSRAGGCSCLLTATPPSP